MASARKTASSVPAVGRASRSTLQDRVYVKLRKALMAGKFIPGQPSSIRGLASELGTSPIPVREALRRLVTEKAFEIHPNGSIVVPIMTRTRFHDLQRARILIEGFATELAAGSISAKDVAQLERVHKQAVDAAKRGNVRDFLAKNMQFRFIIYRAAKSPALLPVIESFWLQFGPFLNFAFADESLSFGVQHHAEAVEAFKRGDHKAARVAIQNDILETGDFIIDEAIPRFQKLYQKP